jgi:hypothetical protein
MEVIASGQRRQEDKDGLMEALSQLLSPPKTLGDGESSEIFEAISPKNESPGGFIADELVDIFSLRGDNAVDSDVLSEIHGFITGE